MAILSKRTVRQVVWMKENGVFSKGDPELSYETEGVCCSFGSREERGSTRGQGETGLAPFISWCLHPFMASHAPALCSFMWKRPQHCKICDMKGHRGHWWLSYSSYMLGLAFWRMLGGEQRSCGKHWTILSPSMKYNKK